MLAHLMDVSIRSIALVLIAAGVLRIPGIRRTGALQHAIWTAVVCGMLALFLLGWALPRLPLRILPDTPLPIQAVPIQATQPVRIASPLFGDENLSSAPLLAQQTPRFSIHWGAMALYAYATVAFAFLLRFAIGMLLVRRLIAKGTPLAEFRESASIAVPLTVGWLRPQILLPLEWREWDRAKLDAVLCHEGAHARRRDGLTAALAGVNRCLFWFHPLAWWLERRLGLLAEFACDESCVAAMGDRERYAQLLLEMAEVVDGSHGRLRQHALTMAASSHIRRRIDSILEGGRTFSRGLNRTGQAALALCAIPVVLVAGTVILDRPMPILLPLRGWPPYTAPAPPPPPRLLAQVRSTAPAPGPAVRLKFEVASIRPAAPTAASTVPVGGGGGGNAPPPPPPPGGAGCIGRSTMDAGRINRVCVSLRALLLDTFSIAPGRLRAPDWTDTQRFDISATLPSGANPEQLPAMFQSLLEDRFGLTFHREKREGSVNALVVAKGGLKVQPAAPESAQPAWVAPAAAVTGSYGNGNIGGIRFRSIVVPSSDGETTNVWQSPSMGFVRRSTTGGASGVIHYEAPSITPEGIADLVVIAGNGLDPAAADMTGMKGRYQVNLDVSMADLIASLTGPGPKDPAALQDAQLNMVQEGLKKLGLQLAPRKATVETIVIDHLEKTPTAN